MAKAEISGSWYNSGFHGHYRSKSRNDFMCEYRHLAKPLPPNLFSKRTTEPTARHVFSKHDNRNSFLNSALYFEQGLGKKSIKNETNRYRPDLLAWMPAKKELENSGPKYSNYTVDYRGIPVQPVRQKIIRRPKTSFDEDAGSTTSYRYAHGRGNPNKETLVAMAQYGLTTVPQTRQKGFVSGRESVASCMSWHVPCPPQTRVPAATETVAPSTQTNTAAVSIDTAATSVKCTHNALLPSRSEPTQTIPQANPAPTQVQVVVI